MQKRILLKNGLAIDAPNGYHGTPKDMVLAEGRILAIGDNIPPRACDEVIDLAGAYVAPGFIDSHVHVYTAGTLSVKADRIGVATGVTTVIDAGSAGPDNFEDFIERDILTSQTRVLSNMHFCKLGLASPPEADDPSKYDIAAAIEAAGRYSDYVVGIKARASNSTVGRMGIIPIRAAKQLADAAGLPVFVHIGNPPPLLEDVLRTLGEGDIITHSFHGKAGCNIIVDGHIMDAAVDARRRGVLFDVGHGEASFNFNTARQAFSLGFWPDSISTDLHSGNVNGPVFSLVRTMDKLLAFGMPLEECVRQVTAAPAKAFDLGRRGLGYLGVGACADLTVFTVEHGRYDFKDSNGNELTGDSSISVERVFLRGEPVMTKAEVH